MMTREGFIANRRVLIVDDNRMIHEDFKKILGQPESSREQDEFEAKLLGKVSPALTLPIFELMFAAQGQAGAMMVKDARENDAPVALAFVDMRMPPGWDGVETIENIWRIDPRVQIAICTAYSDHTCEEIIEKFGHTDQLLFIRKPFDNIEIFQIACAMVNKWNLAQQVRNQMCGLEEAVRSRTQELEIANAKQIETEKQFHHSQKMEAIGRLTGGVAHDFNNLLTVVLGYVELLTAKRYGLSSDVLDKLMAIQSAASSAARLTQQLLAFSRQSILSSEIIDINELIEKNLKKMLERIIGEKIALTINLFPDIPTIRADQGQLEQVIMNLVVNAKDAMEERGGKLTIETSVRADSSGSQEVVLSISDTGNGMTQAVKEKIFEPFYTTKEQGKGTGLGLSTTYGIVNRHKGHIVVTSEPNHGSTFTVSFPVETGEISCLAETNACEILRGNEAVLLVEDEEAVRALTKSILTEAGYSVLEAKNGLEAYQLCVSGKAQFALLLTDVMMPEMGGKELANRLKALMPKTPVLFMSGYTGLEPLALGSARETVNFLQKPFTPKDLLRKVRASL